jgi:hypothetical protein
MKRCCNKSMQLHTKESQFGMSFETQLPTTEVEEYNSDNHFILLDLYLICKISLFMIFKHCRV